MTPEERAEAAEAEAARLRVPVVVTALGRMIGTWYPVGTEPIVGDGRGKIGATEPAPAPNVGLVTAYRRVAGRPKA